MWSRQAQRNSLVPPILQQLLQNRSPPPSMVAGEMQDAGVVANLVKR
jgi:hypothetical protein